MQEQRKEAWKDYLGLTAQIFDLNERLRTLEVEKQKVLRSFPLNERRLQTIVDLRAKTLLEIDLVRDEEAKAREHALQMSLASHRNALFSRESEENIVTKTSTYDDALKSMKQDYFGIAR